MKTKQFNLRMDLDVIAWVNEQALKDDRTPGIWLSRFINGHMGKAKPKKTAATTAVLFADADPMKGFNEFWDAYPKKKAKQEAVKAWVKQDCHKAAGMLTMDVLNRAKVDPSWKETQFIPNAATYINGQRWQDEVTAVDNRSKIEKENDATYEKLFGKKREINVIEGECDVKS